MPGVSTTLGYDEVASGIAQALSDSADINVLEGPPGVGKSWLAKGIGALWQSGGGSAVVAEGDSLRSDVAFYPFGFAMAALPSGWKSVGAALAGIAKAGEVLLGSAGVITATVENLAKLRRNRRRDRAILLTDAEQDILHELERLMRKRPMLLIADNLHWWDAASLEFLGRLRSPRLCAAFPFLAELRVLAVQTPEPYQRVANPEAHEALLSPSTTRRFPLERVPREGFETVLAALGAGSEPPADVADMVYTFSGGHLALASRCAGRLASGEAEDFLPAVDSDDFLQRLLTERLRALGALGKQAIALLQIAAVWGLTFRRDEVMCASGAEEGETSRLLRYCRDERVLELSDERGAFVHDLYRQYFLQLDSHDRTGIYERMSDCLRLLRPAEYDLRCLNALSAERPREAAALGVQSALQMMREGRAWTELPPTVLEAIELGGLTAVVEQLAVALGHLRQYRFRECLNALDVLPRDLPKCLVAETDYLRAMCLMSTRAGDDRARARSILDGWSGYEADEPEVGLRLMQLLLYGLFHLGDKEPGLALETRIRRALIERVSFDVAAKDALYTLDRCAGGLYQVDVSLIRNREAAEYFGPREGQTLLRRPVEYYRCLVNLGASFVSNARYEEAREVHQNLDELVARYPDGVFPRLDWARMNALLAEHRLGLVDQEEAVKRQREISTWPAVQNDPFYAQNALAVYLALAARPGEALAILDRLHSELPTRRTRPEPSMVYLIGANRCVTRLVSGSGLDLRAEWAGLAEVVAEIAYPSRPIYIRRHELLAEFIEAGAELSAAAFDQALVERHPAEFGPLWKDYGRGFMLPAIELWREN